MSINPFLFEPEAQLLQKMRLSKSEDMPNLPKFYNQLLD
jgi:hypothetical protein